MHAITVHQPYAWAIAQGGKDVENRAAPIGAQHIGTDIAIHAGRQLLPHGAQDPRIIAAARRAVADGRARTVMGLLDGSDLAFGAIIAVARLVDCHPATDRRGRLCCPAWGEALHGVRQRPAHHLAWTDVRPLPTPVPCRGMQAVPWPLPPAAAATVIAQLNHTER
ncbi:hypothetical protein [Micromonospora haikouensis]|uniref:hypothetical protein n=1 Tax=Micromonospora haikouensis TaxID=686309 RepID=UPI003D74694F